MQNVTVKYIVKDGQLYPASQADESRIKLFNKSLVEGEQIELYFSKVNGAEKTLGQLAKVHAHIRDIAMFSGNSFDAVKEEVKRKAGLYVITGTSSSDKVLKSFADCNKEELSTAIQACIEIGDLVGFYIY